MNQSSLTLGSCLGALALGSGVFLMPETARAEQEAHGVSIGVNLAFSMGARPAFNVGPELRYTYLFRPTCDYTSTSSCTSDHFGMGLFFQPTYLVGGAWRFTGGIHGGRLMDKFFYPDAEVGISYRTTSTEGNVLGGYGLHLGIVPIFTMMDFFPVEHGPAIRANIALSPGMKGEFILGHDIRGPGACTYIGCNTVVVGRPLRLTESGPQTRAPLFASRSQAGRRRLSGRVSEASRRSLVNHFANDTSTECASIPAFLAIARDLTRAGAPVSLIERAIRSAEEEAVHTGLCRGLAGGFGDMDLGVMVPGLPETSRTDEVSLLKRLAAESFWDGVVGEGAAAAQARRQRAEVMDPEVAEALDIIARDEQAHADLSERIVAFCVEKGGKAVRDDLWEGVERRRGAEEEALGVGALHDEDGDEGELVAFGKPSAEITRKAREEALTRSLQMLQ